MKYLLTAIASVMVMSAGAQLTFVKDINSGPDNSWPSGFTPFKNKLYFMAYDPAIGAALWGYDHTNNTTTVAADPDAATLNQIFYGGRHMCVVNDKLYFNGNDGTHGLELMVYDGNTATLVKDIGIQVGFTSSNPNQMVALAGKLYFTAYGTLGEELYVHDPATNNTALVKDINPGNESSIPASPVVFNGKLYFGAAESNMPGIREMYVHDPAANTTTKIPNSIGITDILYIITHNNMLYFVGNSAAHGYELYSFDGSSVFTRLTDIAAGPANSIKLSHKPLAVCRNKIFFGAQTIGPYVTHYYDLATNTAAKAYTDQGSATVLFNGHQIAYASKLYFNGHVGPSTITKGFELYSCDGTNDPVLAADIMPDKPAGNPTYMEIYDNHLFFAAEGVDAGIELYKYFDSQVMGTEERVKFTLLASAYPNPASDIFSLDINLQQRETFAATLYDMQGKQVYTTGQRQYENGAQRISIPVAGIAAGVYTLHMQTTDGASFYSTKLIRQ